ncbi:hypothetical protein evm_012401 [Chilo suppressalis]|nr:hypothetical protein evm_012401 [Chilo suppressalis]
MLQKVHKSFMGQGVSPIEVIVNDTEEPTTSVPGPRGAVTRKRVVMLNDTEVPTTAANPGLSGDLSDNEEAPLLRQEGSVQAAGYGAAVSRRQGITQGGGGPRRTCMLPPLDQKRTQEDTRTYSDYISDKKLGFLSVLNVPPGCFYNL